MRGTRVAVFAFALCVLSNSGWAQDYEVLRNVRLHAGPSAVSHSLRTLEPPELLWETGAVPDGDYLPVRTGQGEQGWVYRLYVRALAPIASENTESPSAAHTPAGTGELEIHFIDVGQGDSTLVVCPNGRNLLIDAGSHSGAEADVIRDYIFGEIGPDQPRIDALIVTHADSDHYNLIPSVLAQVYVRKAFHVGRASHYGDETVWNWLRRLGERLEFVSESYYDRSGRPNPDIDCGAAEVYFLAANVRHSKSWKNARSIVLMVRFGEFEVILTGDATHATENRIMERYDAAWLDADVLKIGHHGSLATSTSTSWADTVRPEIAVASAGWRSRYGHPRREVLERLEGHTIAWDPHRITSATGRQNDYTWHDDDNYREGIFLTATNGSVVVTTRGDGNYEVSWMDFADF